MRTITANWTCPECGTWVPIHMEAAAGLEGPAGGIRTTVRISVPDTALADAFAHAWTHLEPKERA